MSDDSHVASGAVDDDLHARRYVLNRNGRNALLPTSSVQRPGFLPPLHRERTHRETGHVSGLPAGFVRRLNEL